MPCAPCKLLRRKCTPECIFVPYFPAEQPWKFASVHRVYGTSNVAKLLHAISPEQREDDVNSVVYEAEALLADPLHGCRAYISSLEHGLRDVAIKLAQAKEELKAVDGIDGGAQAPADDELSRMNNGEVPDQMLPTMDGMDGGGQVQPLFDCAPTDDDLAWMCSLFNF